MTQEILKMLEGLKKRPLLYYDLSSLNSLKAYLVGFIQSIEITHNINISNQLFYWLREKTGIDYDIVWEEIICRYYQDKTEEELKLILVETLEEFFIENPDWNKN